MRTAIVYDSPRRKLMQSSIAWHTVHRPCLVHSTTRLAHRIADSTAWLSESLLENIVAKSSASIRIPVSADTVWQLVGGFMSLPDWLPLIASSVAQEGGRVRHLTTQDGAEISERLEAFDNQARTYSYSIVNGPFPVTDYRATLKVSAEGDDAAVVEWSGSFTPVGISDAEAEAIFLGVYEGGLEALKGNF
jgi:hypothetical protein